MKVLKSCFKDFELVQILNQKKIKILPSLFNYYFIPPFDNSFKPNKTEKNPKKYSFFPTTIKGKSKISNELLATH